jgi:3-hydroxyacyl-[acyl-carrier-protein] dehydratase
MTRRFTYRPDHPAVIDHFPGQPVVPAALILSHVIDAVQTADAFGQRQVIGIAWAKFFAPLAPGELCEIDLNLRSAGIVEFRCRSGPDIVASGGVSVREPDA